MISKVVLIQSALKVLDEHVAEASLNILKERAIKIFEQLEV